MTTPKENILKLLLEDPNSEEVMLARGYLIQTLEEAISKGEGNDLLREFLYRHEKAEKVIQELTEENKLLRSELRELQRDFWELKQDLEYNPFFTGDEQQMDEAFDWMMKRYNLGIKYHD